MALLEKIVVGGQIIGGLTPIFGAYWAMFRTIFAGDDIASFIKKSKPANIKDKVKSFYKIANTVDVRDLFGWQHLNSYLEEYEELGEYLQKVQNP